MANFPQLSSGAVTQYPTPLAAGQGVMVVRFLDGSDQRCLLQGRALRQWLINLNLLNESEMQQVEAFFATQQGNYSAFSFPDPFTGTSVPNCRIGSPLLQTNYISPDITGTAFWIIETNG
jgi:hypothetical protein